MMNSPFALWLFASVKNLKKLLTVYPVPVIGRGVRALFSPRIFAPIATMLYVIISFSILHQTLEDPKGRADLVSGDAGHYLEIAKDLAGGNFSMDYVKNRPHRQPLYPATLAPVIRLKGQDFFWLAAVNITFATVGFLVVYAALLRLHASREIASIVGILYLTNPFLIAQTTRHFMTEPLHIMLMCIVIFAFLAHLQSGKAWQLLTAMGAVGLDYLTRPNGLFVMFSLCVALAVWEIARCFEARHLPSVHEILRKVTLYASGFLLFVVITIPSWIPRLEAFGNPIHHGYLSNYLWVDTYKEGHVGQKFATYHMRDYIKTHSVEDAVRRELWGIWNVGFAMPVRADLKFPALFLLALGGVFIAVVRGPISYRALVIFGILQLLPLMWTNLSNPTIRVPYAATMPFEIAFAALLLSTVIEIAKALPKNSGSAPVRSAS